MDLKFMKQLTKMTLVERRDTKKSLIHHRRRTKTGTEFGI